jgi:hypothetical protein
MSATQKCHTDHGSIKTKNGYSHPF